MLEVMRAFEINVNCLGLSHLALGHLCSGLGRKYPEPVRLRFERGQMCPELVRLYFGLGQKRFERHQAAFLIFLFLFLTYFYSLLAPSPFFFASDVTP